MDHRLESHRFVALRIEGSRVNQCLSVGCFSEHPYFRHEIVVPGDEDDSWIQKIQPGSAKFQSKPDVRMEVVESFLEHL